MPADQTLPVGTDHEAADAADEALICAKVEELNAIVRGANSRGLHINLGVASYSTAPRHSQVTISAIERPRRMYRG